MRLKQLMIPFLTVALVSLACSWNFNFNIPINTIEPGATETSEIFIPLPEDPNAPVRLDVSFGAGKLLLNPGAAEALVEGQATYNIATLKPVIHQGEGFASLQTGDLEVEGFPHFSSEFKNEWELALSTQPLDLKINAGAYEGNLELGGLALRSLEINDGAADVRLKFSSPNLVEMDVLRYKTGASNVRLSGLANTNFSNLIFKSGAGEYRLDFSGELKRDANVVIDSGMSKLTLVVPQGVRARVFYDGGLANVDVFGDWQKVGNDYVQEGEGALLTIHVNLAAGALELKN